MPLAWWNKNIRMDGTNMKLQQVLSLTRQALEEYHMIRPGDHIAVGLSGGKDSVALLLALKELQRFYPASFSLTALTVDLGFGNFDLARMEQFCGSLQVPYHVVTTQIADIVFRERREKHPCSLCAKLRKGALHQAALARGCTAVAYAHHKDDFIETMMMSLLYEGRFYSFPPAMALPDTGLCIIRPFLYMNEADLIGFSRKYELPTLKNPCPADGRTKRAYVKQLLQQLNQENPGVKKRLFTALRNGSLPDWKLPNP